MAALEGVWYGDGAGSAMGRIALWPLARLYAGVVTLRSRLYDAGLFPSTAPPIPTISVGNLTVGGTGKTPVAAWLASEIRKAGRMPAIVLRGYGGDEAEVHRRLNAGIPVVANANRADGVRDAQRQGAEIAVLDDAFQHRRIRRDADVVLVSAEQLLRPRRLLPAGPWREGLAAARRADLIVVTRKSASKEKAEDAIRAIANVAPGVPVAVVHLAPEKLVSASGVDARPLELLRGANVRAIAAIGEPSLFREQLEALGARVALKAFRDHHAFAPAEIDELARDMGPGNLVVCTLKDAVKLGSRWPGPSRLWYVSQQLVVDQGVERLQSLLKRVLDARPTTSPAAG